MKRNNHTKPTKTPFFHNLFYNNKYLAVFSFASAIIVWIIVVMAFSPETTYKIQDVPVIINTENTTAERLDLQPFAEKEFTVDVTVEGKRYSVTQRDISPDDITVTANLNYVDSVGAHSLKLVATKNDQYADYEIVAMSSEEIEVYFDAYKEIQVDLKTEELPEGIVSNGYFVDGPVLSTTSVTVCGAATQINRLDKDNIYAKINSSDLNSLRALKSTKYFDAVIDLVDIYGNKISYIEIKDSRNPVIITVPVMKKAEFATGVEFSNTPENYTDFIESITITPETLNIGAADDVVQSMQSVIVGTIDFSDVKTGINTFKFNEENFATELKVFDEVEEITVTVNIFEAASKKVDIDKSRISFTNVPDNCTVSLIDSSVIKDVTIYGAGTSINILNADSVYAVVDMTGYDVKTGRATVEARVSVRDSNCWAYGTYKIPINIVVS